jgi:hypothetical protein
MAKRIDERTLSAALKYAASAIDRQKVPEVPVGDIDVSGLQVVVTFPDGAAVSRQAGSLGDGYDVAPTKGIGQAAVLLYLQRSGVNLADAKLWEKCCRESIQQNLRAEDLLPAEAVQAHDRVTSKLQPDCQGRRKTPAKSIGVDLAKVNVERS